MELLAGLPLSPVSGPTLCRSNRRVRGRVQPGTAAQAAAVVRECGARGWPVHPVSGGKNWGMGSYLPNEDDCVLLDLSALKQIGPLDPDAAAVRIEAGVTQKELYDWLAREAPELAFNVTGAGKDTSIVGNAMERGLGYQGSRVHEFFGMEVVLPDGTEHRPDPAWFSRTGNIPAGPQIEALFFQSNFAVVTAGWLKLRRRQEVEAAVVITGELEPVFETVKRAMECNVLTLPVHMGGGSRLDLLGLGYLRQTWKKEPTMEDVRRIFPLSHAHSALGAVHGRKRLVFSIVKELRSLAHPAAKVRLVTDARFRFAERWSRRLGLKDKATFFSALRPLFALAWGEANDAGLASIDALNPDESSEGCIYFSAVSAPVLADSQKIEGQLEATGLAYGLTRYFMVPDVLVHVMSVHFADKDGREVAERVRALCSSFRAQGWPPYRLGVPTMVASSSPLPRRVKTALDPAGLVSPGHYVA